MKCENCIILEEALKNLKRTKAEVDDDNRRLNEENRKIRTEIADLLIKTQKLHNNGEIAKQKKMEEDNAK